MNGYVFHTEKYGHGRKTYNTTPLYSFTDGFIPSVKGTKTVGKIITDGLSDETNPSET
jgi:hypothetical protein